MPGTVGNGVGVTKVYAIVIGIPQLSVAGGLNPSLPSVGWGELGGVVEGVDRGRVR